MNLLLQPWYLLLAVISEWVRQEQEKVIEYLHTENQVLKETFGQERILLNDDQRRRLSVKGKVLGRKALQQMATVAQADTVLRWYRELVETNRYTNANQNTGRPPTDKDVVELVVRMARENVSWGYKRIEGALHNLGYRICSSTVANILKQHEIEPAPQRGRQLAWKTFLKAHMDALQGADFLGAFSRPKEIFSLLPTLVGIIWQAWSDSGTPSTDGLHRCVDDVVTPRFPHPENIDDLYEEGDFGPTEPASDASCGRDDIPF